MKLRRLRPSGPWGLKSPSSRRAWIEIRQGLASVSQSWVALLAEGVDRNHRAHFAMLFNAVALLAEGVDRNLSELAD